MSSKHQHLELPEKALRGDTVLFPTALTLCADANAARKGAIIDTSVRTPLAASLNASREHNAALHPGIAAEIGEQEKVAYHQGRYDASRYIFYAAVQETFGKFGQQFSTLIKHVSSHAAHVKGGTSQQVREYTQSLIHVALCQ